MDGKSKEEEEVVNTKSDKIYVSELLKQKFADNEVAKFLEWAAIANNFFTWAWLEKNIYG